MPNVFYSARRTLDRAKHHIRDFHVRLIAFVNDEGWTYIPAKRNIEGIANSHKIVFGSQFFDEVPSIVFDAINNLRSVLDQCGYAAAVASGNTKLKHTAFPFGKEVGDVDTAIKGWCGDVPSEIQAIFRNFKPYKRGNPALYYMNKLCNAKKHAILTPTTAACKSMLVVPPWA